MSTDQVRSEFEAWWYAPEQSELRINCAPVWGFKIWQASRASLVVELPEGDYPDGDIDCPLCVSVEEVKSILRATGITVKGA